MSDVAIVGAGIHPFGRHALSGRDQGAVAARRALDDAGLRWPDVQFAFGGSHAAGNADTIVADLGLTGIEFVPDGTNSDFDYSAEDVVYAYDDSGQLTGADRDTNDEAYDYDANGNRDQDITNSAGTFDYVVDPYTRVAKRT